MEMENSLQMVPAFSMKWEERLPIAGDNEVWDWGSVEGQAMKPDI